MFKFTKKMRRLIRRIQKIDPEFNLTEADIEACMQEDPTFTFTVKDLKETLAFKEVWPILEETVAMFEKQDKEGWDLTGVEGNILATPAD